MGKFYQLAMLTSHKIIFRKHLLRMFETVRKSFPLLLVVLFFLLSVYYDMSLFYVYGSYLLNTMIEL